MNKDIKYNGYSAVPSDYECQDGELAMSLNLVPEDGALHPLMPPRLALDMSEYNGYMVVFIHETANYKHYILWNETDRALYWIDSTDIDTDTKRPLNASAVHLLYKFSSYAPITADLQLRAVGNVLIVTTGKHMHYLIWRENDDAYTYLGDKLPELDLSFGLQSDVVYSEPYDLYMGEIPYINRFGPYDEEHEPTITNSVLGRINKFIADEATNKGRFMMPFFVRYALRMFDGSLVMHSPPVLMIPMSCQNPVVACYYFGEDALPDNVTTCKCHTQGVASRLDYALADPWQLDQLKRWKDVITSVDIFISKPIFIYNQNGKVTQICDGIAVPGGYSLSRLIRANDSRFTKYYQKHIFYDLIKLTYDSGEVKGAVFDIPRRKDDDIRNDIESAAHFYLIKSIPIDEIPIPRSETMAIGQRNLIDIPADYLQSLVTREELTEEYMGHDRITPTSMYTYNSRLNLGGITKTLYGAYRSCQHLPYTDGRTYYSQSSDGNITVNEHTSDSVQMWYTVETDGREIVLEGVKSISTSHDGASPTIPYLFVPNVNATKAIIMIMLSGVLPFYYEIELKKHDFLNGAYYFDSWNLTPPKIERTNLPSAQGDPEVVMPNKLYNSQVNNPFFFPSVSANTIGTGRVLGICSAAKALSEGQFGQFPLYAFTTEGVWALEVSATGSYSARQPITRDVCINAEGITQLDSAVLFPTDRGIMLISGSQTQCISEPLNSEYPFDVLSLPCFTKLHEMLGHNTDNDKCLSTLAFAEFLRQCRMVYDYVHQRVIVYAPEISYAYVFSLKSKAWGMMHSVISSHLNSYPEAFAIDRNKNIVDFCQSDDTEMKCLYVTRPLKLDAPNIFKTVDTVIQRGLFRKGDVSTVLYGSRDLVNWYLIWTSKDHYLRGFRGTPYKYFRIAGVATLTADENIYSASVQFTPRINNQPR